MSFQLLSIQTQIIFIDCVLIRRQIMKRPKLVLSCAQTDATAAKQAMFSVLNSRIHRIQRVLLEDYNDIIFVCLINSEISDDILAILQWQWKYWDYLSKGHRKWLTLFHLRS